MQQSDVACVSETFGDAAKKIPARHQGPSLPARQARSNSKSHQLLVRKELCWQSALCGKHSLEAEAAGSGRTLHYCCSKTFLR